MVALGDDVWTLVEASNSTAVSTKVVGVLTATVLVASDDICAVV